MAGEMVKFKCAVCGIDAKKPAVNWRYGEKHGSKHCCGVKCAQLSGVAAQKLRREAIIRYPRVKVRTHLHAEQVQPSHTVICSLYYQGHDSQI